MPFLIDPTALYCKKKPKQSKSNIPIKSFCGTQAQWDSLSETSKAEYNHVVIVDEECLIGEIK